MKAQLCLGTAQFGSNYGITNQFGKPSNEEIDLILENALNYNISFFDTANSYGNSESLIGNKLKNKSLKFITKFSSGIKDSYTDKSITALEENFKETLKNLKRNNIDSYLLHNSNDLKKVNSQLLLEWLNQLKSQGRIKRIGISIYEESDLEGIPLEEIDVVQMPISIYDQRLLRDSFIKKLLKYDISIHIRSIFLQGLLLQEAIKWPNYINKSFLSHHNLYESEVRSRKLSLMDSAISFIKNLDFPELILFGVTNHLELKTINQSWNSEKLINTNFNYSDFRWDNINDIDPRKWIYK